MTRIKSANKSAKVAWNASPAGDPYLLAAAGTGTITGDFDSTTDIEFFSADPSHEGLAMKSLKRIELNEGVQSLAWGAPSASVDGRKLGILASGSTSGAVTFYNPEAIFRDDEEVVISTVEKHTGPVLSLDFNKKNESLLASSSHKSEIIVWDLNDAANPTAYNPYPKAPSAEHNITCVAWNHSVKHILGSASGEGVVVIWDLRTKRPVITLRDPKLTSCKSIVWHPSNQTTILTTCEDDSVPIARLWSLQNTNYPLKTFSGHTAGITSASWSEFDQDLILTCGKDRQTIFWNVEETLPLACIDSTNWNSDVTWSPLVPGLAATASFNSLINVHSITDVEESKKEEDEADPFAQPNKESFLPRSKVAPFKWAKPQSGVSFGFGGKIVYFGNNGTRTVKVANVVTEKKLISDSEKLEAALDRNSISEFCLEKTQSAVADADKETWLVMQTLSESSPEKLLNYLGFSSPTPAPTPSFETVSSSSSSSSLESPFSSTILQTGQDSSLFGASESSPFSFDDQATSDSFDDDPFAHGSDSLAPPPQDHEIKESVGVTVPVSFLVGDADHDDIAKALIVADFHRAVSICLEKAKLADALIIAFSSGQEQLIRKAKNAYFDSSPAAYMQITKCTSPAHLEELVLNSDNNQWKATMSLIISYSQLPERFRLIEKLGDKLSRSGNTHAATLCHIVGHNFEKVTSQWSAEYKANPSIAKLQALIEKVAILKSLFSEDLVQSPKILEDIVCDYINLLASQGKAAACLKYVDLINHEAAIKSPSLSSLIKRFEHLRVSSSSSSSSSSSQSVGGFENDFSDFGAPSHDFYGQNTGFPAPTPAESAADIATSSAYASAHSYYNSNLNTFTDPSASYNTNNNNAGGFFPPAPDAPSAPAQSFDNHGDFGFQQPSHDFSGNQGSFIPSFGSNLGPLPGVSDVPPSFGAPSMGGQFPPGPEAFPAAIPPSSFQPLPTPTPAAAPAPVAAAPAADPSSPQILDLENAIKNLINGLKGRLQHDRKTLSSLDGVISKLPDLKTKLATTPEGVAAVSDYVRALLEFNLPAADSAFHKVQARDVQSKLTAGLVLNLKNLLLAAKKL
eukprot:TRINITY_DN2361_c1_g1_i4.p1 TRINITY_DN2361_c1_g1~~TRINITY_DN2361_c1_g1_i4.p1  ORF type:complete len:1084 (+),score=600.33 TRINITY_DN2361_c1_g1_i4:82-3333(+)